MVTRLTSLLVEACQATIRRENTSAMNTTYTHPAHVRTYVKSYADPWNMPTVVAMVQPNGGAEVQKVGIVA
ncbi:hypothetical protein TUM20985_39380 [Mycobacterium antarcticum]|nr:hypothetical protein TUM20985_39380 [Mycolicibacterium sp. TUM20985]GLP83038.1 hypothetical protein TUM20984_44580 [Mycolicibacterium sp. TUM20984]